jgi:polyhydroxyalkanoate synthesis repressor PhaR
MDQIKVIKKYANRKLYDTLESKYITLKDVKQLVTEGKDVMVIDNRTKADLTIETLFSAICESEDSIGDLSFQTLRDIIKGGGLTKYIKNLKREE